MHDAVQFEKAGIPAVVVVEDVFSQLANAKSKLMGMPDYQPIIVKHPIGTNEEAGKKGREIIDRAVDWLCNGPKK